VHKAAHHSTLGNEPFYKVAANESASARDEYSFPLPVLAHFSSSATKKRIIVFFKSSSKKVELILFPPG
jgi:hypothetical protein